MCLLACVCVCFMSSCQEWWAYHHPSGPSSQHHQHMFKAFWPWPETEMDRAGTRMVPMKHRRSPFSHCWCPSSSNQCHHEHRRMALLQRTFQNVYSAGGEHVPRGGWCPRPQGLPPTQGERPYSTEVPELPLWPRPGPAGTKQSPLTCYLIRNPFQPLC